jgi:para-nitrobenzyl esterase
MDVMAATDAGKVRGRRAGGVVTFLGIPYAAPPYGSRRFAAPAPVEPWDGVRDCCHYGPSALQPPAMFAGGIPEPVIPGEDCLNVNIFTPDTGECLPVLVWIHGGGFVAGSNASPWYRGDAFARDGVVVVAINYRLGIDGFLHLRDAPANRGILDCMAALEWVQRNIAAFGGDPRRVTIAGQSAGAAACAILLSLRQARGLFRRVIAMSGSAQFAGPRDLAERVSARTAEHLGVLPTREALAAVPIERVLDAQRSLGGIGGPEPGERVDVAGLAARFSSSIMTYRPYTDGVVVPTDPRDAIAQGDGSDMAVVIGCTADEVSMVGDYLGEVDDDTVARALVNIGLADGAVESYRSHHHTASGAGVIGRAITDRVFRMPAVRMAESRFDAPAPTYLYEFRFPGPAGAAHCIDIPFAFDRLDAEDVTAMAGPNPPQPLADTVHRAWVDFITTGTPGWPAYDVDRRATMTFDRDCTVIDDAMRFEREIWRSN